MEIWIDPISEEEVGFFSKAKRNTTFPVYSHLTESLKGMGQCIEMLRASGKEKESASCLFVAKRSGECLIYEEVIDRVNLLKVALQSAESIENFLKKEFS